MISGARKTDSLPSKRINIVLENGQERANWINCKVGADIQFNTAGLESYYFANWEPIIFDAFLLIAAIDFCDRTVKRPSHG